MRMYLIHHSYDKNDPYDNSNKGGKVGPFTPGFPQISEECKNIKRNLSLDVVTPFFIENDDFGQCPREPERPAVAHHGCN